MPISFNDLIGFLRIVLEHIKKNAKELRENLLDPDAMYKELSKVIEELEDLEAKQEDLKRHLADTTEALEKRSHDGYTLGSGFVDMMIAAYRKDSIAAKQLRRVRTSLHRKRKEAEPPPSA